MREGREPVDRLVRIGDERDFRDRLIECRGLRFGDRAALAALAGRAARCARLGQREDPGQVGIAEVVDVLPLVLDGLR